ncbi:MAG TPA: succinate dehydrogenase cytochrome b subunit [Egibacteraceae bacterium]|jgi:succinate dehydrogenase / fumarate reductase, cytochrome b subunit|nr:succinate dehydrogenase cytochrome b subunit [Egibacteraceae bacterium]
MPPPPATARGPGAADAGPRAPGAREARPARPEQVQSRFWLVNLYRSGLGKKYVMALTGVVLMAYLLLHMLGNLKLYFGRESMNEYADWLRLFGAPAAPESSMLWVVRAVLLVAFVLHIVAAYQLTRMNLRARPRRYASRRDWVAADFAARTMRWSGVIVLLFVVFHLADLTFGVANPDFHRHDVYGNVVASFQRVPVSLFYILANLALGLHLYHGAWSLFQSMGWNNPRLNHWRRNFAIGFSVLVVGGNVSFPVAVMTGLVS